MPAIVDIKSLHESSRKVQYFDSIALATCQALKSMSFALGYTVASQGMASPGADSCCHPIFFLEKTDDLV